MADEFSVRYSGEAGKALADKISTELTAAETAHTKAINAWKIVKSKFTLNPATMNKLNNVDEGNDALDTVEFKKVKDSLENMITGVGNIDKSWQAVASVIDSAVDTYYNGGGSAA